MFDKKEENDLKVLIIGNDDVLRSGWCKKTDKLAFDRYEIDPEAIFLTEEYKFFGLIKVSNVPTIEFYENSTKPIMRPEKSLHKPDEIGDAVSMAAWALAKLLISKNEKFETMVTYLMIIACICSAAAAGFGFMTWKQTQSINCVAPVPAGGGGGGSGGGTYIPPTATATPTPVPTLQPTQQPTSIPPPLIVIG